MRELLSKNRDEVSVVLAGEAGQGIQTVEHILTRVLKLSGYYVFSTREFMSRIRGGINSTEIRVASRRVNCFVDKIDIMVPLTKGALSHLGERISPDTLIVGEKSNLGESQKNVVEVPLSKIASEVGSRIYINTVSVGFICGMFQVEFEVLNNFLDSLFSPKGEDIVQKNIEAARRGYKLGERVLGPQKANFDIKSSDDAKNDILLTGAQAVALGAIAGGCNLVSFYPMSPATSVGVFLAQHAKDFNLVVEQAEDEISAINMGIGAWYAGARGFVSTSGGGFALMGEGLSLAGMLETPIVLHIGQRPAPATGLPTRTEQADLEFALRAGHGEFPRIILAPGTVEQLFFLTQKAFNLTDRYQVPVLILTDQYLLDSTFQLPSPDLSGIQVQDYITKTDEQYKRYAINREGISPRGIPGYGEGLVVVDSDEHNEEGHITESFEMRTRMVEKRLRKLSQIKKESIPPALIGDQNYDTLVVSWGSTYSTVKEALSYLPEGGISFLHFSQVYPLHSKTISYLRRAKKVVVVENNATSQFGNLIKLDTGYSIQKKILKYNGLPFSAEQIVQSLQKLDHREDQ